MRAFVAIVVVMLAGCGGDGDDQQQQQQPAPERSQGDPRIETYASNLEVPWDMAFLPDGSALVTEREGRVRLISPDGVLRDEPVAEIDVTQQGEGGLLGLALDPDFEENAFVYLYATRGDRMELLRMRYADGSLEQEVTLLDGIRAGAIHDSGRVHFGPDGNLYLATGDAGVPQLAQAEDSLNGKFLRLTPEQYRGDGGADPEIISSGHRNPQGFDWQPGTDRLIASEHGPSGNDEVNEIEPGNDYGWPQVQGPDHGRFTAPLTVYESTIAPSGGTFVTREGSAWSGDLLVAALRGEQLRRIRLDGDEVTVDEPLFRNMFGRLRTVVEGPDGALYLLTSNRDGRGDPEAGDDRIIQVTPPEA